MNHRGPPIGIQTGIWGAISQGESPLHGFLSVRFAVGGSLPADAPASSFLPCQSPPWLRGVCEREIGRGSSLSAARFRYQQHSSSPAPFRSLHVTHWKLTPFGCQWWRAGCPLPAPCHFSILSFPLLWWARGQSPCPLHKQTGMPVSPSGHLSWQMVLLGAPCRCFGVNTPFFSLFSP